MRITITSVLVEDQAKALDFYTNILGFVKKQDVPVGEDRFLTVVSPQDTNGVELLLEPNSDARVPARAFQRALFDANIAAASFTVDDCRAEHKRLVGLGVSFSQEPTETGEATIAMFDDTCGNLIMIASV